MTNRGVAIFGFRVTSLQSAFNKSLATFSLLGTPGIDFRLLGFCRDGRIDIEERALTKWFRINLVKVSAISLKSSSAFQ